MADEKKVEEPIEEVADKGEVPEEGVEKGMEATAEKAAAPEAPKEEKKEAPAEKVEEKPKEEKPKEEVKEAPKEEKKEAPKAKAGSTVSAEGATPAQVVKVFRKVGLYGECYQVLVRVLEGRDKGNLLRRNVRGPVKENDLLMLKETERDVRAV